VDTLKFYKSNGIKVHLITQVPSQKVNAKDAYFHAYRDQDTPDSLDKKLYQFSVSRESHEELQLYTKSLFKENSSHMTIYNFDDIFCKERCLIGNSKGSFYYDDHHLSSNGVSLIKENIVSIFQELD
jgi:hypothetical protein